MRTISLILWWTCIASTYITVLSHDTNNVTGDNPTITGGGGGGSNYPSSPGESYGSSSTDDDSPTNNHQDHPWGARNDPIFPLPVTTWSILQLNDSARSDLCNQQTKFCENECGGANQVLLNFCNQTTMAWGCRCQNKVPDCAPYQWPMTVAECHGREDSCKAGCSDPVTQDICLASCSRYYRCNRPGGPPSLLQTNSPTQLPAYDPPQSLATKTSSSDGILFSITSVVGFLSYMIYWL